MFKRIFSILLTLTLIFTFSITAFATNDDASARNNLRNDGIMPTVVNADLKPPIEFNPLNATPEELKKLHFPQKPTDKEGLKEWTQVMENLKEYVEPVQTPSTAVHGTAYAPVWAGYVLESSENGNETYTDASGQWVQPSFSGLLANPSFWVGLGGFDDSVIVQAGADSNATRAGGSTRYEFWVEDYPNGSIWQAQPVIRAGDTLYVSVSYVSSMGYALLSNQTTGNYTFVSFNAPYFSGSSCDFIHEAYGQDYSSWGSTTFSSCSYGNSNDVTGLFTSKNYTKVIMTNNGTSSGSWEAYPSSASSGSFSVYSY